MEFQHDGERKLVFCRRLGKSWRDLADAVNIPGHERSAFPQGQEAREIWEWLECRDRLATLPERLQFIDRNDLATALFTHHPPQDVTPDWPGSPFPGLSHFTDSEAPIFFGRDAEAGTLLQRLRDGQRFIGVFGASGSGKSSLVWAGLIPRLKEIPGGEHWIWKRFTPAGHPEGPFAALTQSLEKELEWQDHPADKFAEALYQRGEPELVVDLVLGKKPPGAELLLFIDQFEELYSTIAEKP